MTDKIEPALTAEEWAQDTRDEGILIETLALARSRMAEELGSLPSRHGLAALCLHGQPFGFTREDVPRLLEKALNIETAIADDLSRETGDNDEHNIVLGPAVRAQWAEEAAWWRSLAARISALLPPEGK